MKKSILILLSILLCTALLAGCSCQHQWAEATCTEPKTCSQCGVTEGEALDHSWLEADCVTPKTCAHCGLTEGSALGHSWTEATCTAPKTCVNCAATEGQPLEHSWEGEATLYTAPVCTVCGTEGDPIPGYFAQNGLIPNGGPGMVADYTTSTLVRPDLDTTGFFQVSGMDIFDYDSTHRIKPGYEWRSVDIFITFSDNHSNLYSPDIAFARADFYQDQVLKEGKKQETFTVTYNGKEYSCKAYFNTPGFFYADSDIVYQLTCHVQVPIGYDGVVLAFHRGSIDIDGKHLHEVEDDNLLLLRLA